MEFVIRALINATIVSLFAINICSAQSSSREGLKINHHKDLTYTEIIPEPEFKNLNMVGQVNEWGVQGTRDERLYGKILRTLRFQNISRKVEEKYNLPENFILAMVIQETGGVDILPNALNDGGLGLCHMQPSVAQQFGLKVYKNNNKLVDKKHGAELDALIDQHKSDRKKLIAFDDRFHPILNLDAAGRILAYYRTVPMKGKTKLQAAIYGYAGKVNYRKYYNNVIYFQRMLNDEKVLEEVKKEFNGNNPDLQIKYQVDGIYKWRKGDFDSYIKAHQDQNINYGLDKYK